MDSIVKKEQRNCALNTRWVWNAGAVFGAYPTNTPPTLTFAVGPTAEVVSNIAQMLPVIDYLERSPPADVVSPHIHKIKQLRSVYRRHP